MYKNKFILSILIALTISTIILGVQKRTPLSLFAKQEKQAYDVAIEIIDWKKSTVGSTSDGYLINDTFLTQAGTTPGDWYPIGLGRLNIKDNQEGYIAVINDNVEKRYEKPQKLDKAKATEWHRISLAVLASGGNPRKMGSNQDIDLIADGTYNRIDDKGNGILGRQGINGFIWALIALDSMSYEVPENAYYTRDDIILNILNKQLSDGGWALTGNVSDPDITSMAIQSLAPYYNSEKEYTYINKKIQPDATEVTKKVRETIDEALNCLSVMQNENGSYTSWGTTNCESTAQVAVALCSLGIDLFTDVRFIKNGNTVFDGIMLFQNEDGGFIHSKEYDPENPTSLPDISNTMASEQTLYAMAAIHRFQNGQRRLYDFKEEYSQEEKAQINNVIDKIDEIDINTSIYELQGIYNAYWAIDDFDRSYVNNYYKLSDLLVKANIEFYEELNDYNSGDAGIIVPLDIFTDYDMQLVDSLPETLSLENKNEILRLWNKINNCFDFDKKQEYFIKLEKTKNEIEDIENEILSIKNEIKDKLYPFEKINLADKEVIYELYNRYLALSDYDKTQLDSFDVEGLIKSKTKVDNLRLTLIISLICSTIAILISAIVILRIIKRKKEKALALMPESDE